MVVFEGWSLPRKSVKIENESKQIAYWRPIQGVRKCEKVWKQVRRTKTWKSVCLVDLRAVVRHTFWSLLRLTTFVLRLTTVYYFLLFLQHFVRHVYYLFTTVSLLFLLLFNMLLLYLYYFFTTCLLLFTMLILLLDYRFTTWYYMFTTSLLHVCYFSRWNYILLFVDTLSLLIVTFYLFVQRFTIFVYF